MSSTEIAVRDDNHRDTDSWVSMLPAVGELAQAVNRTDFVPSALRGSQPAVIAAILAGRELNLPPMQSLQHIHVIDGRPTLSAQMQRSLALAAGYEISIVETNTTRCIVEGRRSANDEWTRITWTMDDAKKAGLAGRQNWQRHPRRMLQARATAELCQLIFSDAIAGMASTEEMQDDAEGPGPESIANGHAAPAAQPAPRTARRGRAQNVPPAAAVPPQQSGPDTPPQGSAGGTPLPPLPGEEEPDPTSTASGAGGPEANTSPPAGTRQHQDEPDDTDYDTPGTATRGKGGQLTAIWTVLKTVFGFTEEEKPQARAVCEHIIERKLIGGTTGNLSRNEAGTVLDTLAHWQQLAEGDGSQPREVLVALMAAGADGGSDG